jgi:hypothetical protein
MIWGAPPGVLLHKKDNSFAMHPPIKVSAAPDKNSYYPVNSFLT